MIFLMRLHCFLKFILPVPFLCIVQVTFLLLSVNSLLFLDGGFAFISPLPVFHFILMLNGYISKFLYSMQTKVHSSFTPPGKLDR